MAALSITTTQVIPGSGSGRYAANAAETITAGQAVYKNSAGTVALSDADDNTDYQCDGIALNGASAGQPVNVQTTGTIVIGTAASVAQGTAYFVGPTPGAIGPVADVLSGDRLIYLGIGDDSNGIVLNIHNSGVTHV